MFRPNVLVISVLAMIVAAVATFAGCDRVGTRSSQPATGTSAPAAAARRCARRHSRPASASGWTAAHPRVCATPSHTAPWICPVFRAGRVTRGGRGSRSSGHTVLRRVRPRRAQRRGAVHDHGRVHLRAAYLDRRRSLAAGERPARRRVRLVSRCRRRFGDPVPDRARRRSLPDGCAYRGRAWWRGGRPGARRDRSAERYGAPLDRVGGQPGLGLRAHELARGRADGRARAASRPRRLRRRTVDRQRPGGPLP